MSRAEERGLERVPPRYRPSKDRTKKIDSALPVRKFYIEAYQQAEKDLALTWEDMERIYIIVRHLECSMILYNSNKELYQEVLRRFNETRK